MHVGYDPAYGARPLKRTLQKELEKTLGRQILEGKIKDGQTVVVDYDEKKGHVDVLRQVIGRAKMTKKATLSRPRKKLLKAAQSKAYQEQIAASIAKLDELKPKTAKAAKTIALFKSWLKDGLATTRNPGQS